MGKSLLVVHGNDRKKNQPQNSESFQTVQIIGTADEETIDGCYNVKSMYRFTITSQCFCCVDPKLSS